MKNNSISWKEGMFLLPQHFQGQENYFESQLSASSRVDQTFGYGFRDLEIDSTAFEDWKLTVSRATGRTQEGTLFDFLPNEIPSLDLRTCDDGQAKQRMERNESVPIYLAISTVKPNTKNITTDDAAEVCRYREFEADVYDLHTGINTRQIVFKKLKAVLTSSNQRGLDFEYLPIGKLELTESGGGQVPRFSITNHPPLTRSLATEGSVQMYQKMEDQLSGYLRRLIEYLDASGFGIAGIADQEDSETLFRYFKLSELRGWLVTHNQSQGRHPFDCFQHLCQVVGQLAIVDPQQERLVNYIRYDHEDIFASIDWAWQRIRRCFVDPGDTRVRRIPLIAEAMQTEAGNDVIMKAVIPPEMFQSDWQLYIAFNYGDMNKEDAALFFNTYLQDARQFYWKLGSHEKIDRYFVNREQGVMFDNPQRTKSELPKKPGWIYSDIIRDEYWDGVMVSGTICLRIDQENLRTPMSDLGTEKITVGINQRTFQYRMSIFGVKRNA
ncbi:MAG: type VI secretion system baseplate subunit TssK [Planctomycetota bacterium]